jgi:hypothetical protein
MQKVATALPEKNKLQVIMQLIFATWVATLALKKQ